VWPFLRRALSRSVQTRELDERKLADAIANRRLLQRLPWRIRRGWASRVAILIDHGRLLYPVGADQSTLAARVKRELGRHAVAVFPLSKRSYRESFAHCLPLISPGAPVLALTDLGCLILDAKLQEEWYLFGKTLIKRGHHLTTLAPCPKEYWNPQLAALWNMAEWDHGVRLPRYALSRPSDAPFTATARSIAEKDEKRALDILALLSTTPFVHAAVLRHLRYQLGKAWGDIGTESLVWNHPMVKSDALGFSIRPEARAELQKRFIAVEQRIPFSMSGFLQERQGFLSKLAQATIQHAILKIGGRSSMTEQETMAQFRKLLAYLQDCSTMPDDCQTLRFFLSGFRERAPRNTWESDVMSALWLLASERYRRTGEIENLPEEFNANALKLIGPPAQEQQTWSMWQRGGYLEFAPGIAMENAAVKSGSLLGYIRAVDNKVCVESEKKQDLREEGLQAAKMAVCNLADTAIPMHIANIRQIHSTIESIRIDTISKPSWATAVGRDRYGLWAEFTVKNITQRMRWIPPGRFLMGSPEDEKGREGYEGADETQHEVTLAQGYWLADTACTQALWEAVMGKNPSRFKDDPQNPVENVSWDDICLKKKGFLVQLDKLVPGLDVCLPTEAQWEYACRAGTATPFWWGSKLTTDNANYDGNYPYADGAKGEYRGKTMPVKSFERNPWGLWQMHGNVWEWCQDWFGAYPKESVTDPEGSDKGTRRVLRGGCWFCDGRRLRSAFRCSDDPSNASDNYGFRLARGHSELRSGQKAERSGASEREESLRSEQGGGDRSRVS
jgi:formylglycine-generating enzyme required for sulfatase activity